MSNIKTFQVMSRFSAERYSYKEIPKNTVIISIGDIISRDVCFHQNPGVIGICRVKFDDVEEGELNCITQEDANKIADFVKRFEHAENFVVHCQAGVSRSAGCCAAIMYYFTGSDWEIFNNPKYSPNMTVYRKVLNALMGFNNNWEFPEEEAEEKIQHNIEIWKEANDI